MINKPYQDCYWVEPGRFLAGQYPGSMEKDPARRKLRALLEYGITVFIDLTEEREHGLLPYNVLLEKEAAKLKRSVQHIRMSIPDGEAGSARRVQQILRVIDENLASGKAIYVHCFGGHGRTGMVVGCYLVQHGYDGQAAPNRVILLHSNTSTPSYPSPETGAQRQMVLNWKPIFTS